jgi:peroxiredoxin
MEAASVEAVQKKLAGTVQVVGVAWAGNVAAYEDFVDRHGLTFPNLDDTAGEVYRRYGVAGQPAWAFISRDGSAEVELGGHFEADLEKILRNLAA